MRTMRLLGILMLSSAVVAAPTAATAGDEAAKSEKQICKRGVSTVGTRFVERVCLTKSEWKRREAAIEEARDRLLNEANKGTANNNSPASPQGEPAFPN